MTLREGVTAVVAAHNVHRYISRCIDSLLTGGVSEIIVVDDASTDSTVGLVTERFGAEPRVQLHRLTENSGPARARNEAIALASQPWIAIVDADDWCAPERFVHLLELARRYNADIVSDDQYLVEDGSERPWSTIHRTARWRNAQHRPVSFHAFIESRHIVKPMIRRTFLSSSGAALREDLRHSEDFLFYCELLLAGAKWHMSSEAGYYYTTRRDSITGSGFFAADALRAVEALLEHEQVCAVPTRQEQVRRVHERCVLADRVRTLRGDLLRRDVRAALRTAASHPMVVPALVRHELRVTPLRVARSVSRLSPGGVG
jgi:succinoglycan biosynthesis protein ExoO